ncbi:MAG TPA: carbohydrate ABC transporter permease [Thermomicrobiales bacterium]|nr:carbohydrate ABC transporter permease [Thermomicrobiales bacterium]
MTIDRQRLGTKAVVYGLIAVFLVWTLAPIYWMVATSFKSGSQLFTWPPTYIPNPPDLSSYVEAFVHRPLLTYARNSAIVAAVSTPISVSLAALAAFGFSRFRFRGQGALLFLILALRMLPGLIIAMPLFFIFRRMGLVDNLLGLVIAYTAFNLPFNIWLLEAFFRDIPQELADAATVDGASPFRMFLTIMVPLAAPGLVASAILCLLLAWNEFSFALILTYTLNSQTLPIAISGLTSDRGTYFGALAAAGTLAVLPVFLFSLFVQRYLVQGLTAGAVKG